jgi:uncharacterized protein (DUF58 family)
MNSPTRQNKRVASRDLLQPKILAQLSSLELVAKTVVDGFFTGMHRSPFFGFSQEFAEYKAYNDGDDPRFIDWNVYARTDRTYIKRYLGETNTAINLVLDVSASMGYRSAEVSKLQYAKFICATLAHLARKQHDALGITLFDDQIRQTLPPASHPDTLYRVLALLEKEEAGSGTQINDSLQHITSTLTKRGMIFLVSDFYCDAEVLKRNLEVLVQHGHEVTLFHILDAGELNPSSLKDMRSPSTLRDLETGTEVRVTADYMRDDYPARIQAHMKTLEKIALRCGFAYVPCNTEQPLDDVMRKFLLTRQHYSWPVLLPWYCRGGCTALAEITLRCRTSAQVCFWSHGKPHRASRRSYAIKNCSVCVSCYWHCWLCCLQNLR